MIRTLLSAAVGLLFIACSNGTTDKTMLVSGQVKGLKKGTLYLQHLPDSVLVVVDSLEIDGDGNFSFQTELESPEIFYLYLAKKDNNDINDRITFFGEPGTITINTKWNTFDSDAKITGSKTHKIWEEYRKTMSNFNKRNLAIIQNSMNAETPLDSIQLDSLQRVSDKNAKRGYAFAINFALNNKNSYLAPYIAVHEISDANPKYLDSINKSLTPEVAGSKYGKELAEFLKDFEN